MILPPIKCPKCGDDRQTEVIATSGSKKEIYCNTCGKSSVIEVIKNG